ncbi:hypothetical protein IAT38_007327 [Cryptococcus sp. DSM 104549]
MKLLLAAALIPAVAVNAYTSCMLTCMSEKVSDYCPSSVSSYNDTSCLCNTTFITQVKNCLYQSSCSSDVPTWYNTVDPVCNVTSSSSSSSGSGWSGKNSSSSSAAASGSGSETAAAATSSAASTASASGASSGAGAVVASAGKVGAAMIGMGAVVGGALLL